MPNPVVKTLTVDGVTYNLKDVDSDSFAPKASPALTGTPTAPTPSSGASDTQIATVKYVQDSMAGAGAGTVTSVGVANATNGGLSVSGSPITGSGTISVGHSNVLVSAQTTSGIYPIKIDKNGHISEYGNAVSIPTKTSDLTNDSGFVKQFIVTITENNDGFSADKTFLEIVAAYNSGYEVVCHCMIDNSFIPFLALDNNMVQFELSAMTGGGTPAAEYIRISNTNEITHEFMAFTEADPIFSASVAAGITSTDISSWNGKSNTDEKVVTTTSIESDVTYYPILGTNISTASTKYIDNTNLLYWKSGSNIHLRIGSGANKSSLHLNGGSSYSTTLTAGTITANRTVTLPDRTGTIALTSDIPTVPTKTSDLTNDSGYLTASDIASVMIYKGTKANYAALPASGNTTGDVWHLTDTGAEWAWDGSTWQELGTAIDLSGYATKATTLAGYGIADAKIQNGTITLGSNSITPLTSFTETDPVFTASPAHGIATSDITNWNGKTAVSIVRW